MTFSKEMFEFKLKFHLKNASKDKVNIIRGA